RTNIKFLVKLCKSGGENREMLVQVYVMKKTEVYKWVTCLSEGRESVTDEERSEQPAMSRNAENIAKVRQIVCENHRLTVRSKADQANIDRKICVSQQDAAPLLWSLDVRRALNATFPGR
ncbi:hypothetical protein B7P43_G14298, partial [Cryptotermes secundus]